MSFSVCFVLCYVILLIDVLFSAPLSCLMHASLYIPSLEDLARLTKPPRSLIRINSFNSCADLTADCCTSMNEAVHTYEAVQH